MDNKDQAIQQFMELTAADNQVATFYLESAKWNIEAAVTSYYANDLDEEYHEGIIENTNMESEINESVESKGLNNINVSTNQSVSKNSQPQRKIMTLSSLKPTDSDDETEERGQAFYVGGSERGGGQQVLGPPRHDKNKQNTAKIQDLFKSAQSHGAEVVDIQQDSGTTGSSKVFSGSGHRLGDENTSRNFDSTDEIRGQSKPIKVNIKIWSNGFTIDDGPLRSLTEPNDVAVLHSLSNGQFPTELLQQHKYAKLDVNMEDHSSEEFKSPLKPKVIPFQGAGQMLGSPVPKIIFESNKITAPTSMVSPINVDEKKPVTQIQIRLADNSRLIVRMNHTHTIGDLKKYIISQNHQYQNINFNLMTTFPNKVLSDESVTIQDANLLNAVIVQRLI